MTARATPRLGAWSPCAGNTAQHRPHPAAAPSVTGGSLTWTHAATVTVTGSTDAGGTGVTGYQYRISTDGGTTWGTTTRARA